MFCPECGSKNVDNAVFCENCGTKLQDVQAAPLAAPEKKRISLDSSEKTQLIAILVAVVAVILFFVVYNSQFGAKSTAEKYAEAVLANDWNKMYNNMLVKADGDFMSKEAFVTAQSINASEKPPAYTINKVTEMNGSFSKKSYRINYNTVDHADVMEVTVERKGLMWKAEPENYIFQDFTISVPKGAKVTLDKVEVPEKYKRSEGENGQDIYHITPVFGSMHYIELSGEGLESTGQLVQGVEDEVAQVRAFYSKKTIENVTKQATKDLQVILDGAAANKRFSDISALNNMYANNKEDAIYEYENMRDDVFGNADDYRTFQRYEMTNMEANSNVQKDEGNDILQISLKGNYVYNYLYRFWSGSAENEQYDGTTTHTLSYIKSGDEWQLYSIGLSN